MHPVMPDIECIDLTGEEDVQEPVLVEPSVQEAIDFVELPAIQFGERGIAKDDHDGASDMTDPLPELHEFPESFEDESNSASQPEEGDNICNEDIRLLNILLTGRQASVTQCKFMNINRTFFCLYVVHISI